MEIRILSKHGKGVREIAREVGVSRTNAIRMYDLDDALRRAELTQRPARTSSSF